MCELCTAETRTPCPGRRRRIWETSAARHCSIIGTCLTLEETKGLARKLGYVSDRTTNTDFYLHGHFVREAGSRGLPAKLINKLLDRKYAASIRRFKAAQTNAELSDLWDQAYRAGDIAGPYWAILTHPLLDEDLAVQVYGDVHMLSHLVGASNRADRMALRRIEQAVAPIEEELKKASLKHQQALAAKQQNIDDLQDEIIRLRAKLALAEDSRRQAAHATARPPQQKPIVCAEPPNQERADLSASARSLRAENALLLERVRQLEAETRAMDLVMGQEECPDTGDRCLLDLNGTCVLYVGGRAPQVCRFRSLIEQCNGNLLYHDGGKEMSMAELASAIGKADTVVFPTDCVSHSAALRVKRLCRQSMKPYLPLRTSGTASLMAGLRRQFEALPNAAPCSPTPETSTHDPSTIRNARTRSGAPAVR